MMFMLKAMIVAARARPAMRRRMAETFKIDIPIVNSLLCECKANSREVLKRYEILSIEADRSGNVNVEKLSLLLGWG